MISGPAASVRIKTSSRTPLSAAARINGSNLERVIPLLAALERRPALATLERSPEASADSRKFFTAKLFPVESVFEVVRAAGAARLAVAWRAKLVDCWGAGAKAAAVEAMKAA